MIANKSARRVTVLSLLYFLSSSSLLVLNKIAITAIPNASLLLLVQIASTVFFVAAPAICGTEQVNFRPKRCVIYAYSTVAVVFLATIYSNFRVIHAVGVNPFIVIRCSTPLMVAGLDWAFMGRALPNKMSLIALLGMFSFGTAYAYLKLGGDITAVASVRHQPGTKWCIWWLLFFLLDMIYIKYIVEKYKCSGSERTLYQNALALPILVIFLVLDFEEGGIPAAFAASLWTYIAVTLTCVAGAVLSYTGMSLRSELSATVFTVLGISCKMASTLLNEVFVEPERNFSCLMCITAVILCSSVYRQAPLR